MIEEGVMASPDWVVREGPVRRWHSGRGGSGCSLFWEDNLEHCPARTWRQKEVRCRVGGWPRVGAQGHAGWKHDLCFALASLVLWCLNVSSQLCFGRSSTIKVEAEWAVLYSAAVSLLSTPWASRDHIEFLQCDAPKSYTSLVQRRIEPT